MKPKLEQSAVKRNKTMLHNGGRTPYDHQLIFDMELVTRINQALAGNGLRLQPTRRGSVAHPGRTGYEVVYKKRTFNLWIGIEDFARALGILNAPAVVHRHVRTRP